MRPLIPLLSGSLLVLGLVLLLIQPQPVTAQLDRLPQESRSPGEEDEGPRLPNGKLQRDVILTFEHGKNLADLREIQNISTELIAELEENTEFVLSLKSLKKLERMEKLTKDVRKRVKR